MSIETNQTSELPWGRRPVTSRDLAIFVGIIVLVCIGGAALIAFSIRDQTGTAGAGTADTAVSAVDQPIVAGSVALGEEIFTAKCTACHSIGEGIRVGPDLQGVTQQRDPDWLARWITEPDMMLAEGDPIATELLAEHNNVPMPNLQLTSEEVDNVIAYLANPDDTSAPAMVEYSLRASSDEAGFVGVGGRIDGVLNPELSAHLGDTVRLTLINGSSNSHDIKIDAFDVSSGELSAAQEPVTVEFVADQLGMFHYYASLPGQRDAGLEGVLRVEGAVSAGDEAAMDQSLADGGMDHAMNSGSAAPAVADAVAIIRNPADVPPPITATEPQHHVVELTTMEVDGQLDDGTTFRYMTFNGQVPGPMLRMRIGDTMEVRINNQIESILPHSIDLHAVTGPGGGAEFSQTMAGEVSTFNFRALQPGLYVYHCATPSIAHHISSGMYGLILVEPEEGLPEVDHEFYVMQGEIYTEQPFGTEGHLTFSHQQMLNETPQYYVFNGAANALTLDEYAMRTEVGDSVRIYFGVGGPNKISSFHMIGEIFDRVYPMASLSSPPLEDVQTTMVPPGGATVVEFTMDVPGRYIMVDHALSRLERGLVGFLYAEGEENPDIFGAEGFPEESGH
jgi:nitrite reductase (NO-forming)